MKYDKKDITPTKPDQLIALVEANYLDIMGSVKLNFTKEKRRPDDKYNWNQLSTFINKPVLERVLRQHLSHNADFTPETWKKLGTMKEIRSQQELVETILRTGLLSTNVVNGQEAQAYLRENSVQLG